MNKIKLSLLLVIAILVTGTLQAQSFKMPKTSGKVIIEVSEAVIEAYEGNDIIVTTYDNKEKKEESKISEMTAEEIFMTGGKQNDDSKSKGLRVVNSNGLVDNTGLGVSAKVEGNNIKLTQVGKNPISNLMIKVPKGMPISFAYTKIEAGIVEFKNIESEIEATSQYNEFKLTDVTGAITMQTLYNGVTGTFTKAPKGPVSIISMYNDVDLDFPKNLGAIVNLSTPYGDVFAAPEFEFVVDKSATKTRELVRPKVEGVVVNESETQDTKSKVTIINRSAPEVDRKSWNFTFERDQSRGWKTEDIKGKLNGGGFNLIVKANYGNIYLR